jgi:hypothetical protein
VNHRAVRQAISNACQKEAMDELNKGITPTGSKRFAPSGKLTTLASQFRCAADLPSMRGGKL